MAERRTRTPVYIVCSPRARAGKTLIARTLTEFLLANNRATVAFDINRNENALAGYLPRYTAIANLRDTKGQMALFDELIEGADMSKVVDLGSEAFDEFFTVMRQINFVEEARRRSVDTGLLFVAGPDRRSAQTFADLQRFFPRAALVPVHNESILNPKPYIDDFRPLSDSERLLRFPLLNPVLKAIIERPGFSFADFLEKPAPMRTELHDWTERIFVEYREMELRLLLRELKSTLSS